MKIITEPQFFTQPALELAPALLGKYLVRHVDGEELVVKIVEVEAYVGPDDKGAHTYGGKRTNRTETMFWRGGHIYVYLIYGMYYCMNIVAGLEGAPEACLIRAVEPVSGIEKMRALRPLKSKKPELLSNGPGKLTLALNIDKDMNGYDLLEQSQMYLAEGEVPHKIIAGPRINIDYAEEYVDVPWRFYIADNKFVSK
ncbi:DNA-3-methyladenine glycosylase [Culicoidibacter larvae]|uniref:Putative 3-methyladenine DNA glycosylase n=1 Tax=Culicoidibacter larvae TaxID=2579976 RepID=A0A5R8QD31_9FIRM|nr:DNA-3-methyladenine glycosylase [Culicoidibacter larvae]TLG74200.1 DNA-3-methyladenine glycosylase [Culicoidibacter larvae]